MITIGIVVSFKIIWHFISVAILVFAYQIWLDVLTIANNQLMYVFHVSKILISYGDFCTGFAKMLVGRIILLQQRCLLYNN